MVGLFISATTVRGAAGLLFAVGLADMMIQIQRFASSGFILGNPVPLVMSVFTLATGGSGVFLVHKEFIPRSMAFDAIAVVTSIMTSKQTGEFWHKLKPLKSCSTWVQNTDAHPCLNFSDNSILDQTIHIPSRYIIDEAAFEEHHSRQLKELDSPSTVSRNAPQNRFHGYYNGSFFLSEFHNDIQCFGDKDFFKSAYYCSFWPLAQDVERSNYCYCVDESIGDGSATCHEFHKYQHCDGLVGTLRDLELSMYILSTFGFCLSMIHFVALICLYYFLWKQEEILIYYDILDDFRRSFNYRKAAAHISHEGVVLTQLAIDPEMPPLDRTDGDEDKPRQENVECRRNQVAPAPEDNRVRNFEDPDEVIPNAQSLRSPTAAVPVITPRAAARAREPTVPALSLGRSIGTGLIGLMRRYLGMQRVVVADPVTPRRRLFQHRVAPVEAVDAELDVANVIPFPHAVPFEGDEPPREQRRHFI